MKFSKLSPLVTLFVLNFASAQEFNKGQLAIFGAELPAAFESKENPLTEEKIDLGRMLYYEPRLSLSQEISCNSCHGLDNFGVDNKDFSDGHAGHKTGRNSPTTLNAAAHVAQFWDGRAPDVEEQAKGPVLAGGEMAMPSADHAVMVLKSIPGYEPLFKAAFPNSADPITFDNMAKAIGAFERKLVTPSRFDDYRAGQDDALSAQEVVGLQKFIATGCTTCHMGPVLGGMMYQKLGLVKPWPFLTDAGRSEISGNEGEKYFFKVPSLRNIEKTGPYLHDGSITSLELLVAMMAEYQLGKTLSQEDIFDITAFLKALTGEVDAEFVKEPALPESGPTTPKPDKGH